ncbi:MAG: hypothetical protein GXP45_05700 [bacterium]|nr:hypothetical protein [bacterium]
MIEAGANEVAQDILKKAFEIGQKHIDFSCDQQTQFLAQTEIQALEVAFNKPSNITLSYISNILTEDKLNAMTGNSKIPFNELFHQYQKEVLELSQDKIENQEEEDFTVSKIKIGVFTIVKNFIRNRTVETGKRVDDRDEHQIRDLYCEV